MLFLECCQLGLVTFQLLRFLSILFPHSLVPNLKFLLLTFEALFETMRTIGNDNYICVSWVHLIKTVHQEGESLIVENEQKDDCTLFIARSTIDQSNWTMFHLCCSHSFSVNVIELLYLQGSFFCDGHTFSFSKQKQWCFIFKNLCKFSTFFKIFINNVLYLVGNFSQFWSNCFNKLHWCTFLLFSNFCWKLNQVQGLMEETFGSSYTNLSTDSDVNREIDFTSNSWALNIDDADSIDSLSSLHLVYNVDKILCLSGLTDDKHSLVFSDVMLIQLSRVSYIEFFKAF